MSLTFPFIIGRTKRAKNLDDEQALQEIATKLKGLITAGEDPPGTNTSGTLYAQYQADSYTRLWVKINGTWR